MLSAILCFTADAPGQRVLMDRVFSRAEPTFLEFINRVHDPDFCHWRGLICSAGKLSKLTYSKVKDSMGNLSIGFLPPSLQYLRVVSCGQRYKIDTRHLPREAR